ncbi:MAG: FHA domain-containing protein [Streptosporangiaceae bacterium]
MGGSSAGAPTNPEAIRASNEEREEAASELGELFAEGRLSRETFMHRMDEALGARDRRQLDRLFTDVPRRRPGAGTLAALRASLSRRAARGRARLAAEADALADAVRFSFRGPCDPAPGPVPSPLYFPPTASPVDRRYTIGRDSRCDLLIEDTTVSRWHARLERTAGRWLLTDLGSTNGTRLNGWRVGQPVPVQAGDLVTFGSALFVVCPDERNAAQPDARLPAPGGAGPESG